MTARWHSDGSMVLDDRTGASLDCRPPSGTPEDVRDGHGRALAEAVTIALNAADTGRGPRHVWLRHASVHGAWAGSLLAVLVGVWLALFDRVPFAFVGAVAAGLLVGAAATYVALRDWLRLAEAQAVRSDIAHEHAIKAACEFPVVRVKR